VTVLFESAADIKIDEIINLHYLCTKFTIAPINGQETGQQQ